MASMPSVTTNGGIPTKAMRRPLTAPTARAVSSAAPTPAQMLKPAFITTPSTMPVRHTTEPTDRSMPPVMMTAVMPRATMATKAKLRVTLNRFCSVAKVSVASVKATNASTVTRKTQNVWRDKSQLTAPSVGCSLSSNAGATAASVADASRLGAIDCPRDQSGDLFRAAVADGLVRDLVSSTQDHDPICHGEYVRHSMTDEHDC